jgi:carbonic anhydrase
MNELLGPILGFEKSVFPNQSDLCSKFSPDGQSPKALITSSPMLTGCCGLKG